MGNIGIEEHLWTQAQWNLTPWGRLGGGFVEKHHLTLIPTGREKAPVNATYLNEGIRNLREGRQQATDLRQVTAEDKTAPDDLNRNTMDGDHLKGKDARQSREQIC